MGAVTRIHGDPPDLPADSDVSWQAAGFTPFEVGQWRDGGATTPETALVMLSAGMQPADGRRVWRTADDGHGPVTLTVSEALEHDVIDHHSAEAVRSWLRACDDVREAMEVGEELRTRRAVRCLKGSERTLRALDVVPPPLESGSRPDGSFFALATNPA